MKILALAALLAVASAAEVSPRSFVNGYWERGYAFPQAAVTYTISVKVVDTDKAAARAQKIMLAADASPVGNGGSYFGDGRRGQSMQFSMPMNGSEKLAKKLIELGDLQSYNVGRDGNPNMLKDVDERIGLLSAELEENREALKKMPISYYFLNTQLTRLKQARSNYEAVKSKAMLSLTLIDASSSP